SVTPLVAGDTQLREEIDLANEALKTPWPESSSGVAAKLTARVRATFAKGKRLLSPDALGAQIERLLLEQRRYQRRTVFGDEWIRGLLLLQAPGNPIPTYLPSTLSKRLPMFQALRVRILAEAHLQQDQYENHPTALRAVALARCAVVGAGR